MGELKAAIENRRSIRKYKEEQVPREMLEEVLRMGMLAPSASNRQPWHFVAIQDRELIQEWNDAIIDQMAKHGNDANKKTAASGNYNPLFGAPTLILVCGVADSNWSANDCGLASENMSLAAYDMELGSCMIGFARLVPVYGEYPALVEKSKIPLGYEIKYGFLLGYPDEEPAMRARDFEKVTYIG
ncbi:nitroreductase [Eubacteriales bacterium OttesenSCG-928-M02]|nr:nitroreductase [Eubacteriales bacterium OttesenSCG-928-M02]